MTTMTLNDLNDAFARILRDEYNAYFFIYGTDRPTTVRCTLEKGSTYGKFHMKIDGKGDTIVEAFENAIRQFPPSPVGAEWDTRRITGPVVDGEFDEVPQQE